MSDQQWLQDIIARTLGGRALIRPGMGSKVVWQDKSQLNVVGVRIQYCLVFFLSKSMLINGLMFIIPNSFYQILKYYYRISLCYLSKSQTGMHKEMEKSCTNDGKRFLCSFYECCWDHSLSEAALLAGAPQKVHEEYETKFNSGRVKVGLQEE